MPLFTVTLYSDVYITRDYSTVQDLDPWDWRTELEKTVNPIATKVADIQVDYYRLPNVLRLEVPYDKARKAVYGCIRDQAYDDWDWANDGEPEGAVYARPTFFWVDAVRLVTAHVQSHPSDDTYYDVVEFDISMDVWSNNTGRWELYNSYVARKHMPRWKATFNSGTNKYDYTPLYYPSAGEPADGAYGPYYETEVTPASAAGLVSCQLMMFIVTAIDNAGKTHRYIGGDVLVFGDPNSELPNARHRIIYSYDSDTDTSTYMLSVDDLLDGRFYTVTGLSAEFVQSIVVFPYLNSLSTVLEQYTPPGVIGPIGYKFDDSDDGFTDFFQWGSKTTGGDTLYWIEAKDDDPELVMQPLSTTLSTDGGGTAFPQPSRASTASLTPGWVTYSDDKEPMMWRSPAVLRKLTDGVGGTVYDVPDIEAFVNKVTLQNMIELNGAVTYVYTGDSLREAAKYGSLGEAQAATLPIYNSAWQSYAAINQVADNIKYNASQVQTALGGVTNTVLGAGMGFLTMGPAGAVMGAAGGIMGAAGTAYGNAEDLRAKRTTIRNSPCSVQSTGSGIAAYVTGKVDLWYTALVMDDNALERLRLEYYYKGYAVERFFGGKVDLHTRYIFDYIETRDAKVFGKLGAEDAQAIAGILDRGTAIYHSKDALGYSRSYEHTYMRPRFDNTEIFQ